MKRTAILGCVALMTVGLVIGCGKKAPTVKPVMTGFTCDVVADYHDMTITGRMTRTTDGVLQVAITEPPALRDVAVSWDGKVMTMSLGGLQIPVDAAKVPQGALVKQMLSALTAVPTDSEATDEGTVFSGTVDGKEYAIVCAPDTGLVRSLRMPQDQLIVEFKNTTILS